MFAYASRIIADEPNNPIADPAAIILSGNARFTMLTPGLVRLEWSPDGKFEDRASQVFINRRLSVPKFTRGDRQGFLTIKTDKIEIRYKEGAGKFDKKNLAVMLKTGPNDTTWELAPPFENTANLGGTKRTLDEVSGSCPLEPGLLSQNGWTFIDDSRQLLFDGSDWPWAVPREKKDAVDWYFFVYGHDYKGALAEFIKVAGRIPLPPRFAFGAWWSRYWAYSANELKQLVKEFREHDVPLDVLVVDMDWHLDGWTGYTWNPKYFPDPDGFLKWVHEQGLKVALNLHPAEGVGKQEKQFPEMCKAMGLDPKKTERIPFDCTDRRFVDAYFKVLHHPMEKAGVDFWWIDWQQGAKTKVEGLDPLWWLNYLHWTDMQRRAAETGRRPLLFSRWGGLGNHRYQIGFSGDTFSNWQSLAFQPHFTATAGNVGYGYWSHDIGGHQPGKVDPELYVRWLQWGALSPIFRTHAAKDVEAERRIWKLPTEYFEAGRKAYQLRYELIPYIYTAARQCFDTGVPICRPLYLEWPEEAEAYKRDGEYMFGDQLLVAPVTEPAEPVSGCAMVEVWLPPGKWTNWYSGRTYDGGRTIPLVVPLDEIPIFVKSGGIVVTQDYTEGAASNPEKLVINIFHGESGEIRHYRDDGSSGGFLSGDCCWLSLSHKMVNGDQIITIGPAYGALTPEGKRPRCQIRLFDRDSPERPVLLDGEKLSQLEIPDALQDTKKICWYGSARVMGPVIRLPDIPSDRKTEVSVGGPGDLSHYAKKGYRGLLSRMWSLERILSGPDQKEAMPAEYPEGGHWTQGVEQYASNPNPTEVFNYVHRPTVKLTGDDDEVTVDPLGVEENEGRKELLRGRTFALLSGLFYKMTLVNAKTDGRTLIAEVRLAPTLRIPATNKLEGRIRILPDGRFVPPGEGEREFHGLTEDNPVSLTMNIENKSALETTYVRAEIEITNEGLQFKIPLEKIILPSINAWQILGPFDGPFEGALDRELPPEGAIDWSASYNGKDGEKIKWRLFKREIKPGDDLTGEFFVDFDKVFSRRVKDCVVYGFTYLEAPEDMDAVLALGSGDGVAIWLNGREVHRRDGSRSYCAKSDRTPVHLKRGINELLVKIAQSGGGGFCVHVEDGQGKPLTVVKPRLSP